jgi:hypothetical protein
MALCRSTGPLGSLIACLVCVSLAGCGGGGSNVVGTTAVRAINAEVCSAGTPAVQFSHTPPNSTIVALIPGSVPYGELTSYTAVSAEQNVAYSVINPANSTTVGKPIANSEITIDYDYTFALAGDCSIAAGQPGALQLVQIRDLVPTASTGLSTNGGLNGSAAVRLVNLSPTAPPVKLMNTATGAVVSPVTSVTFGTASQYGTLSSGTYSFQIQAASTTTNSSGTNIPAGTVISTQLLLTSIPLQTNVSYSIFLIGSNDPKNPTQPYNVVIQADAP